MTDEKNHSFEDIAEALSDQLFTYLKRMINNSPDADGLLKEKLIRIAHKLPGFKHQSSLKAWAYKIATNVSYDYLRKHKKVQRVIFLVSGKWCIHKENISSTHLP